MKSFDQFNEVQKTYTQKEVDLLIKKEREEILQILKTTPIGHAQYDTPYYATDIIKQIEKRK